MPIPSFWDTVSGDVKKALADGRVASLRVYAGKLPGVTAASSTILTINYINEIEFRDDGIRVKSRDMPESLFVPYSAISSLYVEVITLPGDVTWQTYTFDQALVPRPIP